MNSKSLYDGIKQQARSCTEERHLHQEAVVVAGLY